MKLENKYLVLKRADIEQALTLPEQELLARLSQCIDDYRACYSKPRNKYVVINQDEPYFPEVLKLMESFQATNQGV